MSALATDTACQVPEYAPFEQCRQVSLLAQCMTEQLYVRDSIVRALMYLQVRTALPPLPQTLLPHKKARKAATKQQVGCICPTREGHQLRLSRQKTTCFVLIDGKTLALTASHASPWWSSLCAAGARASRSGSLTSLPASALGRLAVSADLPL